jgi:hypothetical protein
MSDQIWSDEELYIDICAEDMLNRKDESSYFFFTKNADSIETKEQL